MKALRLAEVNLALLNLPEWKLEDGRLVRHWTFSDFVQAMAFVNQVAELAERAGHHPDIDVRYSRVTLRLMTHDAGGITGRDLSLAQRLSGLSGGTVAG